MNRYCRTRQLQTWRHVFIIVSLIPTLLRAGDENGQSMAFFKSYLANCAANEIRCIWFLNNEPKVGMVMTIRIRDYSVFTAREVYNWAMQTSETHSLTHPQVLSLQRIVEQLPPSNEKVEFRRAVSVSVRRAEKVKIVHYDRRRVPAVIQRLYDLGGGYFCEARNAE